MQLVAGDIEVRPVVVLLDGVEEIVPNFDTGGRGRKSMSPQVMVMRPQIFVLLKPAELGDNAGVGTELNTFRLAIIQAIARDTALAMLVGSNGDISLRETITDMQTGSTLQGELQLNFWLRYVLNPYQD